MSPIQFGSHEYDFARTVVTMAVVDITPNSFHRPGTTYEFTDAMVPEQDLKARSELAYVLNVDGFGTQSLKVAKYKSFVAQAPTFRRGFKLFYSEDTKTMSPAQVMGLHPRPDVIVYE